jgi:hypothetical protein
VYGIGVVSDMPLALPQYSGGALGEVECVGAHASFFHDATRGITFNSSASRWYRYAALPDGSSYVRWDSVGEFLVDAAGVRITYRRFEGSSFESFQVYMLGQALSFALVKQRFEPLHATVVVVDDRAIAFLGGNASGKSSLAASFLEAGHRLLTDDLLIVEQLSDRVLAYPGPPRIKLFPRVARRLIGDTANRVQMHARTEKLIVPIDARRRCDTAVELKAIYSLTAPRDACRTRNVGIEALSRRNAFIELLSGTFNRRLTSAARLERQFRSMASLTERVPVKKLAYPRTIEALENVRTLVLAECT